MSDPAVSVCLVILDGWGLAEPGPGNAVSLAHTPVFDRLWHEYDWTTLTAGGAAVGLPEGQMGNSEVGHLNLGAGAIVKQDLARIDDAIADGSLAANDTLRAAMAGAPRVHLIGLASTGGVHSSHRHLRALIGLAGSLDVPELVVHAFTDGRDVSPTQAVEFLPEVAGWCSETGRAAVGTVVGRYFAMDRDLRWERTQKAIDLLVRGEGGAGAPDVRGAVQQAYDHDQTDEFIEPTTIDGVDARIRDGDSVIAFNFRPDRMRQLIAKLEAAVEVRITTLTAYDEDWTHPVVFPPSRPAVTLARVVSEAGFRQLHVAETEKYAHVTYFFNGGEETPHEGEIRALVPSPRDVPTYDHKPEMSAREAAGEFVSHWEADAPRFAIINFANPDMVGHTGVIPAAVRAVETTDACLGRVVDAVHATGGVCVVTADHGNCEEMLEADGSPNTSHSLNPVPFLVTRAGLELDGPGILADVAPTALELLGISKPAAMSGRSLIRE